MPESSAGATFSSSSLTEFGTRILEACGATPENAKVVMDHLVEASLRGVDSHGVVRIPVYVQGITDGEIDPRAVPTVLREKGTVTVVDGNKGFGQVAALFATKRAAEKAESHGTAAASVRNLNHVGALAYYGSLLASRGLIGKVFTSGFPRAAPWGGREKLFGTNPLCFAFPVRDSDPVVIDIATTAVAGFKIIQAAKEGRAIPEGWAMDPDGLPTTDPNLGLKGAQLPMAGHKGYGLAVSVEILSRILGGGSQRKMSRDVAYTQGGFLVEAIDVSAFRDADGYYDEMTELIRSIRGSAPAKGFEKVLLPGEPEVISKARRLREGIPVAASTWKEFGELAERYHVALPERR